MIALLAIVLLTATFAQAQEPLGNTDPQPVHWAVHSAPSGPVNDGARFQVILEAKIDPGWHLYALQEPAGGPMATEISLPTLAAADLLRVDQGRPRLAIDPQSHLLTNYFEGTAMFTLRLQANRSRSAGPHPLQVSVRYQSCDDRMCLPPRHQTLEVPLRIRPID